MKTIAGLATAFLLGLCAPAFADQYLPVGGNGHDFLMLDIDSIEPAPNGNTFYATTVWILRTPQAEPRGVVSFLVVHELYDCDAKTTTPVSLTIHNEQGDELGTDGPPADVHPEPQEEGTVGGASLALVCGGYKTRNFEVQGDVLKAVEFGRRSFESSDPDDSGK